MKTVSIIAILLAIIYAIPCPLQSSEGIPLDGLSRPATFLIENDRIYILERASIYIYHLRNFKQIKKFGKAGEGPKEFKYDGRNGRPLSMCFHRGQLLVNSEFKISYFKPDGNYIKEHKVPVDRLLFPIAENYLGVGMLSTKDKRQYLGYSFHPKDFSSQRTLFISDFEMNNPRSLVLPISSFTYNPVYRNRIYLNGSSSDFKIDVYDRNGNKKYTITKNEPRIPIPKQFKTEALSFFQKSPQYKRAYEFIKKVMAVREHYPPIRDLQIRDGKIYVVTFKQKGDSWECIQLDLKGNETGRYFIRLNRLEHLSFYPLIYYVYQNKIYTLVEDEEDEIWKIYRQDL